MYGMGQRYQFGSGAFAQDDKLAVDWYKRAADLDQPEALAACGYFYVNGRGTEQDVVLGLVMIGQAAALGVEHACYILGRAHEDGLYLLCKDAAKAAK